MIELLDENKIKSNSVVDEPQVNGVFPLDYIFDSSDFRQFQFVLFKSRSVKDKREYHEDFTSDSDKEIINRNNDDNINI